MTNYSQWAGSNTTRRWPSARTERICKAVWIIGGAAALNVLLIAITGGFR